VYNGRNNDDAVGWIPFYARSILSLTQSNNACSREEVSVDIMID